LVRGCRPGENTEVFLKVLGAESQAISLLANDFSRVREPIVLGPGVSETSVVELANRKR
jgi:hypothetical protein